jgi:hypothetical protein
MAHDQEVVGSNPSTLYRVDLSNLLAITFKKKLKIKVAKWGKPKKINYELKLFFERLNSNDDGFDLSGIASNLCLVCNNKTQ